MKLLQESVDKELSLPKHKAKSTAPEKQSVVYTSSQITKLDLNRLRIERKHTDVYTGSL